MKKETLRGRESFVRGRSSDSRDEIKRIIKKCLLNGKIRRSLGLWYFVFNDSSTPDSYSSFMFMFTLYALGPHGSATI